MQSTTPWYKQFWPWFLITVPFISVILGFVIVSFSLSLDDSLVIDDYYKQGKAINLQLDKIDKAKELSIAGGLIFTDEVVKLRLNPDAQHDGSALNMTFFHPTLQDRDFEVQLTKLAGNTYSAVLPKPITGKWRGTISPFTGAWKVQIVFNLPRAGEIPVIPE